MLSSLHLTSKGRRYPKTRDSEIAPELSLDPGSCGGKENVAKVCEI